MSARPTQSQIERTEALAAELDSRRRNFRQLVEETLPELNAQLDPLLRIGK